VSDPFDMLRDQLVGAAERIHARAGRRPWWRVAWRRHPGALVAATLVVSGSATAAVVSLSSKPSAPLAGRVPETHATPQPPRAPTTLAGHRYKLAVAPTLLAGTAGWCTTLSYSQHGKPVTGDGNCGGGGTFPTTTLPLFGNPGFTFYSPGAAPSGDTVHYILTGPGVAAVRVGAKTTITARADPGLPLGDRAAVFFLPASSAPVAIALPGGRAPLLPIPPAPGVPGARAKLIHALALVPLDRYRRPVPIKARESGFALPNRYWQTPSQPPHGACEITNRHLRNLKAKWGHVISRIAAVPAVRGAAFLSCVDTEYYFHNWPLQAAILVDARVPGGPPGPLPGATPVPGHPDLVNLALGPILGEITARRLPNAWLLVQGARDLRQRIQVLDGLTVAKIKLDGSSG